MSWRWVVKGWRARLRYTGQTIKRDLVNLVSISGFFNIMTNNDGLKISGKILHN